MQKNIRIGEILIEHGVLTAKQVDQILASQKKEQLPFGAIAERMFGLSLKSVEDAWVDQYHRYTGTIDLDQEDIDLKAVALIRRRAAWQFQVLPIRIEDSGELLIAASRERLARAVTFATNKLDRPCFFRVAEADQLRQHLQMHCPMPEVSADIIERARKLGSHLPLAESA